MEDHTLDPACILKVNVSCCKECPGKLKKGLLKINGVYSVSVDVEKKLVYVTGKVDPMILIKMISKMGKTAKLVSYDKEPINSDTEKVDDQYSKKTKTGKEKCSQDDQDDNKPPICRKKGKEEEEFCCFHENDFTGHKVEDYVPPQRDEGFDSHIICRDPYCRLHSRSNIIRDRVPMPPRPGPGLFNVHGYGHRYHDHPRSSSRYSGLYRSEDRHYSWMPPPGYGFHRTRRMPGIIDNFTHYFNDDNTRGCSIM